MGLAAPSHTQCGQHAIQITNNLRSLRGTCRAGNSEHRVGLGAHGGRGGGGGEGGQHGVRIAALGRGAVAGDGWHELPPHLHERLRVVEGDLHELALVAR